MKKNTCLIKPQINALQKEYGIENLSFLSDLEDISKLNDVLKANKALDNLRKKPKDYDKFVKSVKDAAAFRSKNFTLLLTGIKDTDKLKGYTWSALNPIAEAVNSGIISLFNIVNLQKLTDRDRRKNITELDNFFTDFLVDEEGEPTLERTLLDDLRFKFRNNKEPYGNINNPETFSFYVKEVIPFLELFLRKYYTNYFNPVIFTPIREKFEEENPGKTISEITKMSREFAEQSANKDLLVGTFLKLRSLISEIAQLTNLEGEEFKEKVQSLDGYELVEKILDSFSLKDPAFSSLLSSTEGENEEDLESQATDENVTRGFEVRGDEKSGFEAASNDTRSVLASLFGFEDNKLEVDKFGLPVLIDSYIAYKQISLITRGIFDYTEFYDELKKNVKKYPYIQQLLDNHLPNPNDPNTVERFAKLKPLERNRKERIKQSLLQDLSKDQVIAKEVNLEATRNKFTNQETQTLNINNAKLKSASLVYNDSVARFVQNYVLLRDRYFKMPMVTKQGYVRLSAFYKAYTVYQKILPSFSDAKLLKELDFSDVKAVLAVLGIVPSPKLSLKSNNDKLYQLLVDYSPNLDKFFKQFKFNTDFGKVAEKIQNKTLTLESTARKSKEIAIDKTITNDAAVKKILNSFKVEIDPDGKAVTNSLIEYIIENYVNAVREERANVNGLTKQFQESIIDAFDSIMSEKMYEEAKPKFVELITKINNPISQLDNSITELGDIFQEYANLEYKLDTQYQDDMIVDYRGKPRSQIQMTNNLILKAKDLSSKKGSRQIFNRFPEFDPKLNVLLRSSLIFNQLYDIDDFGNATRSRSQSTLEVNTVQGIKLKSTYLNAISSGITDLNLEDNLITSFFSLLMNANEESYNVGKSSIYNIRFSNFERQKYLGKENRKASSTADRFLPIPVDLIAKLYSSDFKKYVDSKGKQKKIRTLSLAENALDSFTPIANVFANYLSSYLLLFYEIEKGDLTYAKNNYENLAKNYAELSLFEADDSKTSDNDFIITKELKDKFKDAVLKLEFTNKTTQAEKMAEILNVIKQDEDDYVAFKDGLLGFFQNQVNTIFNNIPYTKNYKELSNLIKLLDKKTSDNRSIFPYIPSFRINTVTKALEPGDSEAKFKNTDLFKALLMTYAINYTILNHEKMLLFFGDPMFVKDYAKRANAASSTAKYCLLDDWDIALYNHPNNHEAFAYAKNLNKKLLAENKPGLDMNLHKLDYTFKFGIVKDNKVKSEEFYNNLRTGFINSYKLKFKDTYDEQELQELAEKEADKSLREYQNMNEADGFGFITFDWYRILSKLTDDWNDQQESLYMKIINGETVSAGMLAISFPVKKFLYNGVTFLKKGDIPADSTHKYALAPLIPGSGDNNLQTKHDNLVKEGKIYEIFTSASKRETIAKNISTKGLNDSFYDGDPKDRIILPLEANADGKYESGKTALYGMTMLLKEQVHVDTDIKTKAILARQLKRIIKTDLYNQGVPMDFQTDLKKDNNSTFADIKAEWNSLTDAEKRSRSKTHSTYRGVMDAIKKINIKELDNILEKLGVEVTKDKKGKLNYVVKDIKKILNLLNKELEKRSRQQKTGASTVYSSLLRVQALSNDAELEAFDNLNTLKSMIKSILDKDIRLRKYNGSNLVQAPITGNEPIEVDKRNILTDANSYLKFYRATENGTLKAEVMLTFDDRWKHLLKLTYNNRVIGNLDTLNEALLDEKWREENETKISLLAVRVPIQDPNSIEAFVIKQFLPKSAGSKIVVPTEIVAKAGSDFDIDKLIVYYFNPDPKTGIISFDETTLEGLENVVIKGYLDLLLMNEMFYKLVSANNITALKKSQKSDPDMIIDYLEKNGEKSLSNPDRTTLRTPFFNLAQKTNLNSSKYLLGHGANTRSYFEELKHSDFVTSLSARFKVSRYLNAQDEDINQSKKFNIVVEPLTAKDVTAPIRFPFIDNDGDLLYNTSEVINKEGQKEGDAISLSSIYNKNKMQISEIISATMNGFVDVEKDDWITKMKINEYLTGINYMFLMGGTPIETIGLFNNQKVIQDFVLSKASLELSPYKKLLSENKSASNTRIMMDIINNILSSMRTRVDEDGNEIDNRETEEEFSDKDYRYELSDQAIQKVIEALSMAGIESDELTNYIMLYNYREENADARQRAKILLNVELENIFFTNFKSLPQSNFITNKQLEEGLNVPYKKMDAGTLALQFKLLSFFPFLQEYAGKLGNLMAAEDYDKATSQNIADEYSNQSTIRSIKSGAYFPKEVIKRFESLNVSADYNISKLTIELAESIFGLTENKTINRYAIRLAGILYRHIKRDKVDSFINAFKSDFTNFIVQNYGTIPVKDSEGNVTDRNIVEYLVNESVFVDKDTREGTTPSYRIERVSLPTKLFALLDNFKLFSSLEALSYLKINRVRKKESEEDEPDSFIYQLGRMFRNLSPNELTNYNKDTETFGRLEIKVNDALDAIEQTKGDIFNIFNIDLEIGDKVITIEEILEHLNSLKPSEDSSYSEIKEKKINPEILSVINKLVSKSNEIKDFVANTLPYLSILQTTSSYSPTYISNLFVKRNYDIKKKAIRNFKAEHPDGVTNEILDNYVIQFLLNNMDSYIKNDKKGEILKAISGALVDERSGELEFIDYKYSNIINNSNYFNNYHMKNFDVFAEDLNFDYQDFIKDIVMENRLEQKTKTRVFDFNTIFDREKKDKEKEDSDSEAEDDLIDLGINLLEENNEDSDTNDVEIGQITIEKGTFFVMENNKIYDINQQEVTDPIIKNMVLVNYASKLGTLKMVNEYFVVENKIINRNFEEIDMSDKSTELIDLLIAAHPYKLNC